MANATPPGFGGLWFWGDFWPRTGCRRRFCGVSGYEPADGFRDLWRRVWWRKPPQTRAFLRSFWRVVSGGRKEKPRGRNDFDAGVAVLRTQPSSKHTQTFVIRAYPGRTQPLPGWANTETRRGNLGGCPHQSQQPDHRALVRFLQVNLAMQHVSSSPDHKWDCNENSQNTDYV